MEFCLWSFDWEIDGDEDLNSWEMVGNLMISNMWEPCMYDLVLKQKDRSFVYFIQFAEIVNFLVVILIYAELKFTHQT